MSWDRGDLAEKAFYYDEDISSGNNPATPYPSHVEALRRSMLDFSCPVVGYRDLGRGPGSFHLDISEALWQMEDTDPALRAAQGIQNAANHIHDGGYAETKWQSFFLDEFVKPLSRSTSASKVDSRRVSRCSYYYDAFKEDTDALWSLFSGRADDTDMSDLFDFETAKCPKPDCALYLPMYHLDAEPKLPKIVDPGDRQWNQAPNHSIAEAFSWSTLRQLFPHGLRPTPFRGLHVPDPPKDASLRCYPWLIIEHKKEPARLTDIRRKKEVVCCQATNAAACAIQLNQLAARYTSKLAHDVHIPPIPTVTTIGSHVKVWIMYFGHDFQAPFCDKYSGVVKSRKCKRGYVMRAIWDGDMTKVEDIVKFQLILENTHTWAMRVFKPLVASYIDQWRVVHCQAGVDATAAASLRRQEITERCQIVVPMVQGILDNHSTIELGDRKHPELTPLLVGMLVQQICASERLLLANEVDRIVTEKIKGLKLEADGSATKTQPTSQDQDRRASTGVSQSSLQSLDSTTDNDDPNDGDYEESQATTAMPDTGVNSRNLAAENAFRRSTVSSPTRSPSPAPSRGGVSDVPSTPRRVFDLSNIFNPAVPSILLEGSAVSLPTTAGSLDRASVDSPSGSVTTTPKSSASEVSGTATLEKSLKSPRHKVRVRLPPPPRVIAPMRSVPLKLRFNPAFDFNLKAWRQPDTKAGDDATASDSLGDGRSDSSGCEPIGKLDV